MASTKFQFENGIGSLLRDGRLVVPPNQRSYAWEDRHVQNLLQDLNEAITITNDQDEYLGTIVLIEPPKTIPSIADGQENRWQILVDGELLDLINLRSIFFKTEANFRWF
jgi:uncharacterized protein with ParB-like and HNH nuclease domain